MEAQTALTVAETPGTIRPMEHGYENPSKEPDAPRRRVYHPRHPAFAFLLAAAVVAAWLLYRVLGS